jgi:hypothetical protein
MILTPEQLALLLPKLYAVLGLALLDVVVGVLAAFKEKRFDITKIPDFLAEYGLKIVGWAVLEAVALLPGNLLGIGGFDPIAANAAYTVLVAGAIGSILKNIAVLGGNPTLLARVGLPPEER